MDIDTELAKARSQLNELWNAYDDPEDKIHYENILLELENYAANIKIHQHAMDSASVLSLVNSTTKNLNEINEKAGGGAIETPERDIIVTFIVDAASSAGLNIEEFEYGDPTYAERDF